MRLRWEPRLEEVGPLIADGFRMDGVTDRRLILLNPAIQSDEDEFRRVFCHEVVHVAVVAERDPHGPIFQSYLRQLVEKGAFKGIVATDQEKAERRRDLDQRAGALASEAAAIARNKAQLESDASAPGASPETINARVATHNAQVRRHNDAVVELNRAIEDYNQMVSYPDGLDRQRMATRAPVAR